MSSRPHDCALIQAYVLTRADSRNEGMVDGSLDAQLRVAAIDVSLRYRQQWARAQPPGAFTGPFESTPSGAARDRRPPPG